MFVQSIHQCSRAPQKHAAVPKVISCSKEAGCALGIRFLREAANTSCVTIEGSTGLDVAVAGLRALGSNAQYDDIFTRRCDPNAFAKRLTKAILICDHVVGGKHADYGIGIISE